MVGTVPPMVSSCCMTTELGQSHSQEVPQPSEDQGSGYPNFFGWFSYSNLTWGTPKIRWYNYITRSGY